MIPSNELRRGNKVTDEFYENFGTIITVESINDKGINLEIADDGNWPECATRWIEPEYKFGALFGIPLTPEVLEKCGFEKDDTPLEPVAVSYKITLPIRGSNENAISVLISGQKICGNYTVNDHWGSNNFEHLHQLQNLYFALTGTELEYKP